MATDEIDNDRTDRQRGEPDEPRAGSDAASDAPRIGAWYETDEGEVFQVFAIDEDVDAFEVRFLDSTVDTWVLSDWPGFTEVEPPDAWGEMDNYPAGRRERGE